MKKLTFLMFCAFMVTGCYITSGGRRDAYLKENPKTSAEITESITKGQIHVGMTRAEVIASWGSPRNTTFTSTDTGDTVTTFHYIGTFVYFRNGIVATITRY